MNLSSDIEVTSSAVPGVTFRIRRMGIVPRSEVEFKTLPYRRRLREIEASYPQYSDAELEVQKQIAIIRKKALTVPSEEAAAVIDNELAPLQIQFERLSDPEVKKLRAALDDEWAIIEHQIDPFWIRAGLISISHKLNSAEEEGKVEAGELDGMTADQLCEIGPPLLAQEVLQAVLSNGKLRPEDRRGFKSPGTSGAPAAGLKSDSTAPNAKTEGSTTSETASSTSQG